jgi:hypothetical protein
MRTICIALYMYISFLKIVIQIITRKQQNYFDLVRENMEICNFIQIYLFQMGDFHLICQFY